jgi:hypothetical protein
MDRNGAYCSAEEFMSHRGETRNVIISYRWTAANDGRLVAVKQEVVDHAIERLLLRTRPGLRTSGPITICVEHCEARRGHHDPFGEMKYLKMYIEGQEPSTIIAY